MFLLSFNLFSHAVPLGLGTVELILSFDETLFSLVPLFDNLVVKLCFCCAFNLTSESGTFDFLDLLLKAFVFTRRVLESIAHDFEHLLISFHNLDLIFHGAHFIILFLVKPCQLFLKRIPPCNQYAFQSFMYEIQISIEALFIFIDLDNLLLYKRNHLIDRRHIHRVLFAQLIRLTETRRRILNFCN